MINNKVCQNYLLSFICEAKNFKIRCNAKLIIVETIIILWINTVNVSDLLYVKLLIAVVILLTDIKNWFRNGSKNNLLQNNDIY